VPTVAATVFAAPGSVTLDCAIALVVVMATLWAVSIPRKDVSIVDPVWGPLFAMVAVIALLAGGGCLGRRWLLFALAAVWGLRLGVYLAARKRHEAGEDRRYAEIRERRGDSFVRWSLFGIFGLQGLLVLIVSLPIQVAAGQGGDLTAAVAPGVVVYLVGLVFESVGDEQLRRFKAVQANRAKVMDRGLWRYTRHPNYFGDFCVWWGVWLVALTAGGTWWTFVGPLVMSALLIRVSGAARLERDIAQRRPEYADYIKRTSAFFPWPPRNGGDG
jgi:steroid 5-alpha reductase family enzyme